jgi:hypothetical protein
MSDVLSVTVSLGGRYPSTNHTANGSHRAGPKSPEYKALFDAVKCAAEAEIARTGWVKADGECLTIITRYVPDRRRCDAVNLGTSECNALTAAGVWADDRLAQPCIKHIRHDPNGEHRVSIVVVQLHHPVNAIRGQTRGQSTATSPRNREGQSSGQKPAKVSTPSGAPRYTGGAIPDGFAVVNGKLVSRESALKMLG